MRKLRIGLLGCGGIARRHAAAIGALSDQMQLVASCGRDESKVAAFANEFGAKPYVDCQRMLDSSELDLLIVALPPHAHTGQVEAAARAGVHLLVEKPIALDMQRANAMVAAARLGSVASSQRAGSCIASAMQFCAGMRP